MLLGSSSSPVLESLLAPLVSCHTEPLAEFPKHEGQAGEAVSPKSLSFPTRASPSSLITSCLSNRDPHLPAPNSGCPPLLRLRKVLSENDLCILTAVPPARVAADSLLHDDNAECCPSSDIDPTISSSHYGHLRKARTSLPLSRWRSLGSFPSELSSVFFDSDSAILEETESAYPDSSPANEEEEGRGERIRIFDKLAFPVGIYSNIKVEQVNEVVDVGDASDVKVEQVNEVVDMGDASTDAVDVGVQLKTVVHARLYQSTSDKIDMQGVGCGGRGSEMNLSKLSVEASFSGRQEPSYMVGQGTSCLFEGREGGMGTTLSVTLSVPQMHGQASQPKYVYHGDPWEMALGAGDGGRGARPPTSTGGGGGSGEAGGHSGRNSDPTELHYQSILKNNPGHALILQNYAQYLAEVKGDYRKAEEFFQRAILANPSDGELLGQYAKMLWEVQQDRERAATYFERAVQAAPDNSYVMAAYASFLWSSEEEEEESVEEVTGSSPANVPASRFSLVSAGLA